MRSNHLTNNAPIKIKEYQKPQWAKDTSFQIVCQVVYVNLQII